MVRGMFLPYSECLIQTKSLMFEEAMADTETLIAADKLKQYSIETKESINRLIHVSTGRFNHDGVSALYSVGELPVIHNTSRLAKMILREAHMGQDNLSHRKSPSDIIGRSREHAVIYKPYHLAVSVVKSCPRCMLEEAKTKRLGQKIGEIEVNRLGSPSCTHSGRSL